MKARRGGWMLLELCVWLFLSAYLVTSAMQIWQLTRGLVKTHNDLYEGMSALQRLQSENREQDRQIEQLRQEVRLIAQERPFSGFQKRRQP